MQSIRLSNNRFGEMIPEFPNVSSSLTDTTDFSDNKLEGPIRFVFDLAKLIVLDLSSNKLNGTVELYLVQKLRNLTTVDLSYNNLTVIASVSLEYLNLSRNLLVDLERSLSLTSLSILDLHHNQLQGSIPVPPSFFYYVDYSSNNFSSFIPPNIGNYLSVTIFFSLSNNHLTGAIPQSICNNVWLLVLDLSNNSLSGKIPSCLIEGTKTLRVLNLRRNNFDGFIPDKFPRSCVLKTLDLSGNNLQGKVPKSLANCATLEVLDLGNNKINDSFPCLLKSISSFRVLVLRNNMFSGLIGCPGINGTWPRLQIVDLAFNHFRGNLPHIFLETWEGMMEGENRHLEYIKYELTFGGVYYQDSIAVTFKGREFELVKILTVFTSADFSNNNFEGPIPEVIGKFKALYVLNLSHNALTGRIPSSFGNLSHLEALDLSSNQLTGQIPLQLARLSFLSAFESLI
ncbi:hypothetical protein OIU85_000943 [Salix viminalis]|uniref:Malectin-like domain-containing protein n=1 Tax=Salix viminalis TaxID=40686 RepID=A0A9Q0VKH3_SALVM|nr:hypothetical protein OIU85_000943 [Salix viminalis]